MTPKLCYDKILPRDLFRHHNHLVGAFGVFRAISPIGKAWMNGSTLRVMFMDGPLIEEGDIVREQAVWWSEYANIKFRFCNERDSEIRIAFNQNDGAWSYVGTDCRDVSRNEPTMNLGFLDGGTVAHEFGHALGLAHEHQSPIGGIQWDEAAVIEALSGPPNYWDEETIRHNVLEKYRVDQIHGTAFDPRSIMCYWFPPSWTTNGFASERNDTLSPLDKMFISGAQMYPREAPGVDGDIPELILNASRYRQASIGQKGEEDLFMFRVTTPGRHVIETRGLTDLFMKLYGPNSATALIADDDDSGIGLNARITRDLIAGQYFVQVRHFNREGGTGKYSIGVRSVS